MARPVRNNVDYFPHEVVHGKKMYIIENKYKNDGYAVWFKLLEELGRANNHYLDFNDEEQVMYLSSKFNVSEELLLNIVSDLAKINAIHKELFTKNKIVFSEKFIESIQDAYKRRNNKCITLESLCMHLRSYCMHYVDINSVKVDINTQSKVEYSKVNKTIQKKEVEDEVSHVRFLLNDYPSQFEQMRMKLRGIDEKEFFNFLNAKCVLEDIPKDFKKINARFNLLKSNWKKEEATSTTVNLSKLP